jgi:uncharacterized protein YebE (UPF0316 family)
MPEIMDWVNTFYYNHQAEIINTGIIFLLNAIGTTLSNLKTVFLAKQITKPVYFTTFIDAIIFAYAVNLISNTPSAVFVVGYAAGKLFGVFLGEAIDSMLAIGILEVSIYKHPSDGILLADHLRALGFSVTTIKGYGVNGKERLMVNVITPRKHLAKLKEELALVGKGNYVIKDVSKSYGKIGQIHPIDN